MKKYKNRGGGSNVKAFETTADSITIEFLDGGVFLYNAKKPGIAHVAQMKNLAAAGQGLWAYITRYVKDDFARKLK